VTEQPSLQTIGPIITASKDTLGKRLKDFPWWFVAIILIAIFAFFVIAANEFLFTTNLEYRDELDSGIISEQLKSELKEFEYNITDRAELIIQRPGEKWKIKDARNSYFFKVEDNSISVEARGSYGNAFDYIKAGIAVTITTSLVAYGFAMIFGLLAGLGRISGNIILNNLSRLYVELIRGIPMMVLIFFIALVGVPLIVDGLNGFGVRLSEAGYKTIAAPFLLMENQAITMNTRAIVALAVTYGAFLAEIFRAGIQSITRGQMEAARSLGMSYGQSMRYVILPQAIRNVLPALGNDFVAMVKDSSLVSVLAVRDITQSARLYSSSTFRFKEGYITLSVLYLTMTVLLSLVVQVVERRLRSNE
jgi:polar amino acid transport system permease protein